MGVESETNLKLSRNKVFVKIKEIEVTTNVVKEKLIKYLNAASQN